MTTIAGASRADRLEKLFETGPQTSMGKLLRQFWHPVALASSIGPKSAKGIRILGENLTLYRGESGQPYLVGGECLHRLTRLHTGQVEGEQIRCMYHGWRFNREGLCTERPAEQAPTTPAMKIAGYKVREYAGLIFAYMGDDPDPAFDLPRHDAFERPGDLGFTRVEVWPCNWFQHVENSLDPVHVSFAHMTGLVGEFGKAVTAAIPQLSYEETSAGIKQVATRDDGNIRVSDWTFPNRNHVRVPGLRANDPWIDTGNWMVPVDDTHTARFSLRRVPSTTPEADARITEYFAEVANYNAADHHDELFDKGIYPTDPLVRLTSAQDYVALVGQGAIADRRRELLGASDKGIAYLRRIFLRELDAIDSGSGAKKWQRNAKPVELPLPRSVASLASL